MASNESPSPEELTRLLQLAHESPSLSVLVRAQYEVRSAIRRAVVLRQWSLLETVERDLAGSPLLAARFTESLHYVLETPELSAGEPFGRLHGLVLAIPVAITCKSGTLSSLPHPLGSAFRESLQARFPGNTVAIRFVNRLVPQLVAHDMGPRSLYEMIRELASGGRGAAPLPESPPATGFQPHGRSQGQHYLFTLALVPQQEDLAHYGDLQNDPGLVKWSAAQTEAITSNFAERGWPLLVRVSPPRQLRQMLSSPLLLSDVRELDGLLEHFASRLNSPVTALKAELAMRGGEEPGVRIDIRERRSGNFLARALYRLASLGAEAGAYRVAVRLASAGAQLGAADEALARVVERAVTLTKDAQPSEVTTAGTPKPRRLGTRLFRAGFSRPPRQVH